MNRLFGFGLGKCCDCSCCGGPAPAGCVMLTEGGDLMLQEIDADLMLLEICGDLITEDGNDLITEDGDDLIR